MKNKKIYALLTQIDEIISAAEQAEADNQKLIDQVDDRCRAGAINLLHYSAFREYDISKLKKNLRYLGLSKLSRSEGHILASLKITRSLLCRYLDKAYEPIKDPFMLIQQTEGNRKTHAKELLGPRAKGRRVRIMVTVPAEAAVNKNWAKALITAGMDVARINCAHDGPEIWKAMIDNIKAAGEETGKQLMISMDLGGPKIRTGAITPEVQALKFKVRKNNMGKVLNPLEIVLIPKGAKLQGHGNCLQIPDPLFLLIKEGEELNFRDARGKKRKLKITKVAEKEIYANLNKNAYITSGTKLQHPDQQTPFELGVVNLVAGRLKLQTGDHLLLHADPRPGANAVKDEAGAVSAPAHISCIFPEIFQYLKPDEKIFFDDGQIEGRILSADAEKAMIEIVYTRPGGESLRADKGINLPESHLPISGLTEKDKKDLDFVVKHADVVNFSFVNTVRDVEDLLGELRARDVERGGMGVILKIETAKGFQNLIDILLAAMQSYPLGVMIARGDLAVECGWEKLGLLQHEIMRISEAAHVPDVWATQVLDNLAKKGIPTRAEITDVTTGQRAECVMLNKGPHIVKAIELLGNIFKKIRYYKDKKSTLFAVFDKDSQEDKKPDS